jgi:hypothetical protein
MDIIELITFLKNQRKKLLTALIKNDNKDQNKLLLEILLDVDEEINRLLNEDLNGMKN